MRVAVWVILSSVVFAVALVLFFRHLPLVGGGSFPYLDYVPVGGFWMLICGGLLFTLYVGLLWRQAKRQIWFFAAIVSFLPLLLSAVPAWSELTEARSDSLHRWEGSDIVGHISAAPVSCILGGIFTALLLDISIFGYVARASKV